MRSPFIVLALISLFASQVSAQCSGRYFDEIFSSDVTNNVNFGSAIDMNGQTQSLDMHIYEPDGDTESERPLIILAFSGSFTAGFKESPDMLTLCDEFAKRGFVTATIDYRLNTGTVDSANMLQAVVRAVQDAKAAVRFFYKDRQTTNTYRIDTNNIFMGGTSAGAFIGIHMAYIPDTVGLSQWMKEIILSVGGGLEGNSGNPGYSSRIHGVINLAGAIGDTSWIDPGEVPMVSLHGDDDGTVPYCSDIINVSGSDIIVADGSGTIKQRMVNVGIDNPFYTWRGADHVPYVNPLPPPLSDGPLYMDTTVQFIRNFLFEILTGTECGQALEDKGRVTNPCGTEIIEPTQVVDYEELGTLTISPNPAIDVVRVQLPTEDFANFQVDIVNLMGATMQSFETQDGYFELHRNDLGKGIFLIQIQSPDGQKQSTGRIIFQ